MSEKNINNVEQIRDLIFGSQIKDFEARFNQINNNIQSIEKSINKVFNEAHLKLQRETDRSLEILEKKIENLSSSSLRERSKLKEIIDISDENFHEQLNNQKNEFDVKLKIIKENILDDNKKLSEDMSNMKLEIKDTLESALSALNEEKLSKNSMAQMLLDVAMKIQDTDINDMILKESKSDK